MRRLLLLSSPLLMLAALGACVTSSDSPTLHVGMSRTRLKSCFGDPLRIEPARSGGEYWYYPFASWNPNLDGTVNNDGVTRSASVSMTISDGKTTQDCPVHLSADGYVIEPLPLGKIVKR